MKIKLIHLDSTPTCITETKAIFSKISTVEYIGAAIDTDTALDLINIHNPNTIVIDINFSGSYISGMEFLKNLKFTGELIFYTKNDKFAYQAFQYNAAAYILKPGKIEDFENAFNNILNRFLSKHLKTAFSILSNQMYKTKFESNQLLHITTNDKLLIEPIDNIEFIISTGNNTNFHLSNNSIITSNKIFRNYKLELINNSNFVEISRFTIINKQFIRAITQEKNKLTVEMANGTNLEVSKLRAEDVLHQINSKYLQ